MGFEEEWFYSAMTSGEVCHRYIEEEILSNAVQKTNVRSFTKNNEEEWEVLTFFVKHYACDGDSMKTFLSFFCRIIQEQEEQRQRLQQREYLLSKRRLSEIHLPTSKRLEYFKLSKREEMKVKEYGEFIAYPELFQHGLGNTAVAVVLAALIVVVVAFQMTLIINRALGLLLLFLLLFFSSHFFC